MDSSDSRFTFPGISLDSFTAAVEYSVALESTSRITSTSSVMNKARCTDISEYGYSKEYLFIKVSAMSCITQSVSDIRHISDGPLHCVCLSVSLTLLHDACVWLCITATPSIAALQSFSTRDTLLATTRRVLAPPPQSIAYLLDTKQSCSGHNSPLA